MCVFLRKYKKKTFKGSVNAMYDDSLIFYSSLILPFKFTAHSTNYKCSYFYVVTESLCSFDICCKNIKYDSISFY